MSTRKSPRKSSRKSSRKSPRKSLHDGNHSKAEDHNDEIQQAVTITTAAATTTTTAATILGLNSEDAKNTPNEVNDDDKKWKNVNRIKIKIPIEQRRDGSISAIIVKKMLVQYDETKNNDEKNAFFSAHNVITKLLDDEQKEEKEEEEGKNNNRQDEEETTINAPANNGASSSSSSPPPTATTSNTNRRGDNESAESTINRRMIHNLSLSKEIPLLRHQEGRRILPALELDTIKKLPPDTKIRMINRRTGKLMESRIPVSELPEMLAKDASLEPIIESSPDDYPVNGTAQVARSNPRATVSLNIRRQKRMKNRFTKDDMVSITEGPNAGSFAFFQEYLAAGWTRLKKFPPSRGPDLIEHKDSVVRIADVERKPKRRKVIPMEDLVEVFYAEKNSLDL